MVDALKRLREPAAVVLLVVIGLQLVVALIYLGTDGGVFAARSALLEPTTALLLVLIIGAVALWEPTPHARLFALLASIGIGVQIVLGLVFTVWAVATGGAALAFFGLVTWLSTLAIGALAGAAVLTIYRGLPAPSRTAGAELVDVPGLDPAGAPPLPVQPVPERSDPSADPSAGQSWRTAGEAATGASASQWGTSGAGQGWRPAAHPDPPAALPAPPEDLPPYPPSDEARRALPPAESPKWWDQS